MQFPAIWKAVFFSLIILAGPPAEGADKKPNILVIFGDDIGQSNIVFTKGLMGYHTPNIDRVAAEPMLTPP